MTNQTIEIADLIKPKFQPRQTVYLLFRDSHGIESIRRTCIERITHKVIFYEDHNGKQCRNAELIYDLLNLGHAREENLFATPEEAARAGK